VIPHNVTISSIGMPPVAISGGVSNISLTFKNTGTTPIIGNLQVVTSNSGFFAIPKVWSSANVADNIQNVNIPPSKTYTLNFKVANPKVQGTYKGNFSLSNLGHHISGSSFNVSLVITSKGSTHAIVNNPQKGYVNVFSTPSLTAVPSKLTNNTNITIIKHISGWYEVKSQNGVSGWVISAYVTKVPNVK
jgi:hypothetical protein